MSQPEPATQIIPFDFDGAPVRALLAAVSAALSQH